MEKRKAGAYDEAAEEFIRLSKSKYKDAQRDDALFQAALCMQLARHPAESMDLARKIGSRPLSVFCQMELLKQRSQWEELLALCGNENFELWPDRLIFPACLTRAEAYAAKGDVAAAESDLVSAVNSTTSANQKAAALSLKGRMYGSRDSQKSLEAYAEVCLLAPQGGGMLQRARAARVQLFLEGNDYKQASEELSLLEKAQGKDPYWICTTLLLTGEYYQAIGKTEDALAAFTKVDSVERAPQSFRDQAKAKIFAIKLN